MKPIAIRAASLSALFICALAHSKLIQLPETSLADPGRAAFTRTPEDAVMLWPEPARSAALLMLVEYGPPTRSGDDALVWLHNEPWEKTVAYRDARTQGADLSAQNFLKQTIGYRVPDAKIEALRNFDPRITADQTTNELTVRSGSERVNFLLMNLADDIIMEKLTPEEARAFYLKTIRLSAAGKSSAYLEGFLFEPPNGKTVTP